MNALPRDSSESNRPLDGSGLERSLDDEFVTQGQIDSMFLMARALLANDGVEDRVNGMSATVTKSSFPVQVGDAVFAGRVAQLQSSKDNPDPLPMIEIDETPNDIEVITSNPLAIHFSKFAGKLTLVMDDPKEINNVLVNDPKISRLVRGVMVGISNEHDHAMIALTEKQKQLDEAKKWERKVSWSRRLERLRTARKVVLGLTITTGVVGGIGYGLSKIKVADFDRDYHNPLTGGTEIEVGESGTPEYSTDLYNRADLQPEHLPNIGPKDDKKSTDDVLATDDTLREVWIYSSKDGDNCRTVDVAKVPLGTKLKTWTDFTAPDGKSRASELNVIYKTGSVEVCWTGKELNNDDDPRVVVTLLPPSNSTSQP